MFRSYKRFNLDVINEVNWLIVEVTYKLCKIATCTKIALEVMEIMFLKLSYFVEVKSWWRHAVHET